MIQIVKHPETDRFVLDGNNTEITIVSTNGAGYYFRAEIYIDDVLFDTQSWSRSDNYTATKDLIYLYNAYFESEFNSTFTNALAEQTALKKKVNITVKEYMIDDDSLVQTLALPEFYILFNTKSASFDDSNKCTVLGLDAAVMRLPSNGKIVVPFFVNPDDESVTVTATKNNGTVINTQTTAALTEKKVFLYTLDLATLETIAYTDLYITVSITVGETVQSQRIYKLMRHPHHSIKEIVFKNNYGFFIPAFFDGQFINRSGFKVETYENYSEQETVYNVQINDSYTINTNHLLENENQIVNQIAQALKCYFLNGSEYLPINTKTSKTTNQRDKEHHFNTKLEFEFKTNLNQENSGYLEAPECDDITINGNENEITTVAKTVFNTAFDPNTINNIVFTALPEVGIWYVVIAGISVPAVLNTEYNYSLIDEFRFLPVTEEFGSPYATLTFQVKESLIYSNEATATINIAEVVNNSPVIDLVPSFRIGLVEGNGSRELISTITDPNGDLDTILWEFEGTPYADTVITDETTETPVITITGGEVGSFELKVTATDLAANETVAYTTIEVVEHIVEISDSRLAESTSGSDTDRIYEILITGGIEDETVDIIFDYDVYETSRYVLVNYGEDTEFMINLLSRRQVHQYTFDSNGEIMFHVLMEDNVEDDHATMTLEVVKPTGDMVVSETNGSTEI